MSGSPSVSDGNTDAEQRLAAMETQKGSGPNGTGPNNPASLSCRISIQKGTLTVCISFVLNLILVIVVLFLLLKRGESHDSAGKPPGKIASGNTQTLGEPTTPGPTNCYPVYPRHARGPYAKACGLHRDAVVLHLKLDHKVEKSKRGKPDEKGCYKLTAWETDIRKNCTYDTGDVVVPKDGLYYVYSQIHFLDSSPMQENFTVERGKPGSVKHCINKDDKIYAKEMKMLFSATAKTLLNKNNRFEYTSYLGAVQCLLKDERVFVKVNNKTLIDISDFRESNFFGLYMVSEMRGNEKCSSSSSDDIC